VKDLGVPFRDGFEHGQDIDELMGFFVHPIQRGLPRDRDQRGAIQIRISHAGEQIGCPRPQSRETDPGLSCQPPMDIGHEGRALLVSNGNKPDLRIHERVQDVQRLFSGTPKIHCTPSFSRQRSSRSDPFITIPSIWLIWFIWFVSFIWLSQTNQINPRSPKYQMNQNNPRLSRQSRVSRSTIPRERTPIVPDVRTIEGQ